MGQKKNSLCLIDWMAKNACKLGTSCTWILWHLWHEQKKYATPPQKKKIKKINIIFIHLSWFLFPACIFTAVVCPEAMLEHFMQWLSVDYNKLD